MFLLIDNYDSFTYNLYHYLKEIGVEVEVHRNDQISVEQCLSPKYTGIVISPGPCTPNDAGICLDLIAKSFDKKPILGVCLGHQSIAQVFGAQIVKGEKPMHAKISTIQHTQESRLYDKIPPKLMVTRYHSLVVHPPSLPSCLKVTAVSEDAVIQSIEHIEFPVFGVQYHPESIASEYGHRILENFVEIVKDAS